ncbi:MAG: biopolymer transporter ExbD [Candidatus Latescibacteria bacterium]|nr:biopolymer transporter ExbD [Candidatus Latescibacterota bacterium]NIO27303.1 biopolymer transporter ExbD [Candidatus Latescibacterota bacterium]NIO54827.1 biopolymer transporter ExbD [Candidatus Latescibacterota bacterium]NIT00910.1 biopolymer transporter ExbD [Candidatus Latescibacterota bacterium]NIT37833.1 biopolymer transporter ExbD [Candidatus Latescibacterota bacterium]
MKKRRQRPSTDIPAASMSDIAFLLLIFFLVTTIFAVEQGIPLALPGQQSQNVKVSRKNLLIIKAYPNGSITLDKQPITFQEIKPAVEKRLAENEKLVVVIETHPDSEYGLMIDILDELKLANARTISLKTMM